MSYTGTKKKKASQSRARQGDRLTDRRLQERIGGKVTSQGKHTELAAARRVGYNLPRRRSDDYELGDACRQTSLRAEYVVLGFWEGRR